MPTRTAKASNNPLDLSNYENRVITMIAALLQKDDIGAWPRKQDGSLFLGYRSYSYKGNIKYRPFTTPSTIKWVAKDRKLTRNQGKDSLWQFRLISIIRLASSNSVGQANSVFRFSMAGGMQEHRQLDAYSAYPYVPADLKFIALKNQEVVGDDDIKAENEAIDAASLDAVGHEWAYGDLQRTIYGAPDREAEGTGVLDGFSLPVYIRL